MSTIDTMLRDGARAGMAARRMRSGFWRRIVVEAARPFAWWVAAMARRRSRLDLLGLTDAQLRDIGLTPRQARREGMRPFWE